MSNQCVRCEEAPACAECANCDHPVCEDCMGDEVWNDDLCVGCICPRCLRNVGDCAGSGACRRAEAEIDWADIEVEARWERERGW